MSRAATLKPATDFMPSSSRALSPVLALFGCGVLFLFPSACRKPKPAAAIPTPVEIAPDLTTNLLANSPSTMLADQGKSPVHWQPFRRETFQMAERANRLVFGVVCHPQQPGYLPVIRAIERDAGLVRDLNEKFVPVLIDADACRETGLLSAVLCSEIRRPLGLPLFLWMSPQGNPVAWIPASTDEKGTGIRSLFDQSSEMVSQTWREDSDYVIRNSKADELARVERLDPFAKCPPSSKQPAVDMLSSIRQLASLYDPGSRSFDSSGSLFPSGTMDLLSLAAIAPGLPKDLTSRCLETTTSLTQDISTSAMIDPLDGGIFNSRIGNSWGLPNFARDCQNQARAIVALMNSYRATGNRDTLNQALAALAFVEKHHTTANGLFSLGRQSLASPEDWLWSMEDLEKILSGEELNLITAMSELRGLGNIPIESDPSREHFRRNSLASRIPAEAAATKIGLNPTAAKDVLESARKKLLKARQVRLGDIPNDPRPHAAATFRMISVYASAYTATGETEWRQKAVRTLDRAREAFSRGPLLQNFPGPADELTTGRAFLYGLAIQSALDVSDITVDSHRASWAEDLATTASEKFLSGNMLRETAPDQSVIGSPLSDRSMLFDDSTVGLLSSAEARLAARGRKLPEAFAITIVPTPAEAVTRPILHTDQLIAGLIREHAPLVLISPDAPEALKEAVCRLPLRLMTRRLAIESDSVPALSVKIVFKDGRTVTASTAAAFHNELSVPAYAR